MGSPGSIIDALRRTRRWRPKVLMSLTSGMWLRILHFTKDKRQSSPCFGAVGCSQIDSGAPCRSMRMPNSVHANLASSGKLWQVQVMRLHVHRILGCSGGLPSEKGIPLDNPSRSDFHPAPSAFAGALTQEVPWTLDKTVRGFRVQRSTNNATSNYCNSPSTTPLTFSKSSWNFSLGLHVMESPSHQGLKLVV
jgi:hypothetical protein